MKHSFLKHSLLSLIIISGTLATGQIGAQGFTVAEVPFIFTYKKLVKVCDEQILTRFGAFFDRWIIEFLKEIHSGSPGLALNTINNEFDNHSEMLMSYMEKLMKALKHAPKYATTSLQIEVEDLLAKIAALIGKPYISQYEAKLQIENGIPFDIPNIQGLIETVKATEFTPTAIAKVAKLFRNADELPSNDPAREYYEPIVSKLGDLIVGQLIEVLKVALNVPDDSKFKALGDNNVAILQSFVDEFKSLFDLEKMREIILENLTGSPEIPEYNENFFTPELFKSLYETPNKHFQDCRRTSTCSHQWMSVRLEI